MTQGSARINRRQLLVPPGGIDCQRRRAALEAARKCYVGLSAIGKRRLLDELQELTGYHRKSLLRLLNRPEPMAAAAPGGSLPQPDKTHHRRRYGPEVDRLMAPIRKQSGSNGWRRPPRAYSAVRRRVPVRT